jgi:hypothetical protein
MASIINTPVTFNYTGVNGYTSTITYSRITGGTSQIQLSIDENATSNKPLGITIAITPTVLNNGVKGSPYTSVTFTATGGSSPYTFSVDSTTLPAGLSLVSNILQGTISSNAAIGVYPITINVVDNHGNTGSQTYKLTITAAVIQPSTPQTAPSFPAPTPNTNSYKYVQGICYMSLPTANVTYTQTVGAAFSNTINQPVILNVVDINGNVIPKGTTVSLNDVSGNVLKSFYTGDGSTTGTVHSVSLYYTPTSYYSVFTANVHTDNQGTGWIPVTTLSATGTGRIIEGSNHANIFGPDVGNYGTGLFAGGNSNNTYIRQSDFLDINGNPLTSSKHFSYRLNGQGFQNPNYGTLLASTGIPTYGPEIGFGQIASSTAGTPYGSSIIDTIIDFYVVTDPLTATATPLKLYTPYTFVKTNQPFWIQTVPPYANNPNGYGAYGVNWGDGTGTDKVDASTNKTSTIYFTHSYTAARNTPYTVTVKAYNQTSDIDRIAPLAIAVLSAQYYVQDTFPEISLANYSKTIQGTTPVLPYSKSEVEIGSNEWVTADNINAVLTKLDSNFDYLNGITKTIRKAPQFELIEWVNDLLQYPYWNTTLSGSNAYTNLSSTHNYGNVPGVIRDFKSYKSPYSAPDYYNYFVYSIDNTYSTLEIRRNNYTNDRVSVLSAVIPGADNINIYTTDVSGNSLYMLASDTGSYGITSLYRFGLNYNAGSATATIINQIGGAKSDGTGGSLTDHYYFGAGPNYTDVPTEIKLYNNKVYVADKSNNCIKVYNAALTYINTIYTRALTGFEISPFDINQNTEDIFMLGTLKAPNAPVIVSVQTSAVDATTTQYAVTWDHDGLRLSSVYGVSANFIIYGEIEGNGGNFLEIDSFYSPAVNLDNPPRLTKYVFNSTQNYINFVVQAMSMYGATYNSVPSSPSITPNQDVFPSPYSVFVFDTNNNLLNTLQIPEVPANANIRKLLVEPTGVFYYIVTDAYIYKYTTTGLFVNRINSPSYGALNEPIVTAFIDDRNYFYIATATRLFKFIDLPSTSTLFDIDVISNYYTLLSAYTIGSNELIQDWVYNKSINAVLKNHEILAKSIAGKYVITVDQSNNLVSFINRPVSATDVINSLSADESSFIHVNEVLSSAVINRVVDKIYNIQTVVLSAVTPEYIVLPPVYTANILGLVTAASAYTYYQYNQPPPIITQQPTRVAVTQGQDATFTFGVSSAGGQDTINYQWLINGTPIPAASASTYTVLSAMLADAGTYSCSAYDAAGVVLSDNAYLAVTLETLFAFASAASIGNLYSTLPNNLPSRYGNDYKFTFDVLNAPLSANLIINLCETHGTTPWYFANSVYITVNSGTIPILTTSTSNSSVFVLSLSSYLSTDSSTAQPDGYPGTYTGKFSVDLSLGPITGGNSMVPRVIASVSEGYLFNPTFTNGLSAGPLGMDVGTLTVYQTSGVAAYAGISNNSLGGYVNINPYISHTWSIDGVASTVYPNNPYLQLTPASTTSSTLTVHRTTCPGETEVTLGYGRTVPAAIATPRYTITTNSAVINSGNGFVTGGGTYSAGSIATIRNVGTYLQAYGSIPGCRTHNGASKGSPLIVTGPGCWDVGVYPLGGDGSVTYTGGNLTVFEDPASWGDSQKAASTSIAQVYVDGNKTITAYFQHN